MISGFYPGSFDPPTNGHIDVLSRAMRFLDRLVVGIGTNADKKTVFSVAERQSMLNTCLNPIAAQQACVLEIVEFEGLAIEAAQNFEAPLIIRGLRNGTDFDYESQMMAMNRAMSENIETICLAASPEVAQLSSTLVRQVASMKGDFSQFVPPEIHSIILYKYK